MGLGLGAPHSHGIAKRRQRSAARRAAGDRSALIVPLKRGNPDPLGDPVEGSDASGDNTARGKHAGDIELRSRVNATTADSEAGEASPADGVHFAESLPRSGMAARGIRTHTERRCHGRRRAELVGVCGESGLLRSSILLTSTSLTSHPRDGLLTLA